MMFGGGVPVRALRGFTLIELLVVVCILGLLMSLMLPAVQATRESGRQAQCKNNLKQLGLTALSYESTHGRFPSNGWGYLWVGDPDRGTGKQQPGGWIYCLLPYMEEASLAEIGGGLDPRGKAESLAQLTSMPISTLICPTRGADQPSPCRPAVVPHNAAWKSLVAKTDYAVNEGDYWMNPGGGPPTLASGDSPSYLWPDSSRVSGICYQRSEVRASQVTDGLSRTYLIGEKFVSTFDYAAWDDLGYDQSLYSGTCADISRVAEMPPLADIAAPYC